MLLLCEEILQWKTQIFKLPLELTSNKSDWAQRPPCEWFCHLLPLTGALWQRRFWVNSATNQQTDLPPRFRPSGSSVHPPACIVPLDNFQSCALTYNCACLYVCLCACQPEHLCVKLTVCDSWGPRTGQRWREEIRYSPSVFITHSPFSPLSHCFTAKNHIQASIYNAQDKLSTVLSIAIKKMCILLSVVALCWLDQKRILAQICCKLHLVVHWTSHKGSFYIASTLKVWSKI